MKLKQLKHKVYKSWEFLSNYRDCLVQPENFKSEVKQFGDLRFKETWVKALANFEALNAVHDCLDAYSLIVLTLNFTPDRWDYEYRHQIFEAFLTIPGALELLTLGMEQLFSSDFTQQEREDACGFFELVEEQQRRKRFPVESIWKFAALRVK
jgi:hypothetical protein